MPRTTVMDIVNDYDYPDDTAKVRLSTSVDGRLSTMSTTPYNSFNADKLTGLNPGSYQIACLDGNGKMLKGSKMFHVPDDSRESKDNKAITDVLRTLVSSDSRNTLAILKEYSSIVNQHTKAFPRALDAMSKVVTDTRSREDALQDIIRAKDIEITELKRDTESGKWDSLNNVIEALKESKQADISNFADNINGAPSGLLMTGLRNLKAKLDPDKVAAVSRVFSSSDKTVSLDNIGNDIETVYKATDKTTRLKVTESLVIQAFKTDTIEAVPIAERVYALVNSGDFTNE